MSLYDIKDITTEARNNLVNAIRTKGVSIADDSTINQCANAITLITGGGSSVGGMKFYKCASVDVANKTWAGYEMMLQDNKYVQSTVLTNGLFFTTVEPVAGNVYTADALITAFPYTGIFGTVDNIAYTSYSCPINPDDYVFGDYVISASTELTQNQSDIRTAYNAFVEREQADAGEIGWHDSVYDSPLPQWLQWQNVIKRVLVNAYTMTNTPRPDSLPVSWQLQGSDDGEHWQVLDNVQGWESGESAVINRLLENTTPYFYHRIYITEVTSEPYTTIGLLRAGVGTETGA